MSSVELALLSCPCTRKERLSLENNGYRCCGTGCAHGHVENYFPILSNRPILISKLNCDTLCEPGTVRSYIERSAESGLRKFYRKFLVGESTVTVKNCASFVDLAKGQASRPRVLVVGSGEKGQGTAALFSDADIELVGVDIYGSDSVDYIADAHYLPFRDEVFDGVWIQAVLEHVLEPALVVSEIYRVLKKNGIVYAETPFMQQVHEGAYDYTRFTVLGHRFLFRRFDCVALGGNKGVGHVFSWALKYMVWATTRSKRLGQLVFSAMSLFSRLIDGLADDKSLYDASSGVFFLGRKSVRTLAHEDVPRLYKGLQ